MPRRPLSESSRSIELRWLRHDGDLRRRRIKRIYVCCRTLLSDGPATANAESRIVIVVIVVVVVVVVVIVVIVVVVVVVVVFRPGGSIPGAGPSNVQKRRPRAPKRFGGNIQSRRGDDDRWV